MKTPKEKAKELVEKFKPHSHFWVHDFGRQKDYDIEQLENAKQCALIAVDELLNNFLSNRTTKYGRERYHFWQVVKQEIELL